MESEKIETAADKPPRKFFLRPAHSIALGFLAVIFLGAFFLCLPISNRNGEWLDFVDALFTSTSAVCVTGLIVVPTAPTYTGFGQAVVLILIQIGGLGLMTLSTLMLMLLRRKITLKDRLALTEALNRDETKGVVQLVRRILVKRRMRGVAGEVFDRICDGQMIFIARVGIEKLTYGEIRARMLSALGRAGMLKA